MAGTPDFAHWTVRFGVFEVDLKAGELRKQGLKIKLQKQPFQLLQMLLEHPSEIVSREALRQRIWPVDTFVDFDHGLNNAIKRLREALCDSAVTPHFIETIPGRGYRFLASLGTTAGQIKSLAVLPLEDLLHHPEEEYFADGLTEQLITNLAKISALHVVSRTTVMQYKGIRKSLREIARDLGVDGIVEGTVLRSGERVRISAQLVNASTDMHMWAESYDRDLRDILALQSEVARAIAKEIQITLTPQEKAQLRQTRTVDPGAYEAFLKGRYHWNKRTPAAVKKGMEFFQRAIEKDPTYAAAYVSLADGAAVTGFWGFVPPEEGFGRAKSIAKKALEFEETSEAHAALAWALLHYDFDFPASEREFRRSNDLNPGYANGAQWYAMYLTLMGRTEEAVVEVRRALQLDPLSLIINVTLAWVYYVIRQYEEALAQCERTIELDPNFPPGRYVTGVVCEKIGMYGRGISELEVALRLSGDAPAYVAQLGAIYANAGELEAAMKVLGELQELSQRRYVMPYYLAIIYSGLKRRDEAFYWLGKAYEEHAAWATFTKTDPRLDGLRSDPRFDNLLRRIGFPS